QKPLGRTAAEVEAVVDAARTADQLLAVDLSYRFTEGMRLIRGLVGSGKLGRIYAADLVFHNAYGPDKGWFYDAALSGGGCVMDLGVHLVDRALWMLDFPAVGEVSARLFCGRRAPEWAYRSGRGLRRRDSRTGVGRGRPDRLLVALACGSRRRDIR